MKKINLKGLITCLLGLFVFVTNLIYYILSFETYSDEYGTDISGNKENLIWVIMGLFIICLGAYLIYSHMKNNENKKITWGILFIVGLVLGIFYLGTSIKYGIKANGDYSIFGRQMIMCIASLFVVAYASVSYLEINKNNN